MALQDGLGWSVIIPVKALHAAKSRMSAAIPPAELAFAFFEDTLAAVVACPDVSEVLVATQDARVEAYAKAEGCHVVRDGEHPGINAAVAWAARHVRASDRLAVVVSDLPCLTPSALASVLDAAAGHPSAFLADADGTGTAMWFGTDGTTVTTHYGADSRAAHRAAGAVDLVEAHPASAGAWAVARRDVDTAAALDLAEDAGLGPHSRAALDTAGVVGEVRTVVQCTDDEIVLVDESGHLSAVASRVALEAGLIDLRRGQRLVVGVGVDGAVSLALP